MKKVLSCTTLALSVLILTSCGEIARGAADNTPVKAFPLANLKMEGKVTDKPTDPGSVGVESVGSQAIGWGLFKATVKFGDLNPNDIPDIVGSPRALDVPIDFTKAAYQCKVTASKMTGTLDWIKLTVSDENNPKGISEEAKPNKNITFTRKADGTYAVEVDATTLTLNWNKFKPVAVLNGKASPNKATLFVNIKLNNTVHGCGTVIDLSPTLKQYVRF